MNVLDVVQGSDQWLALRKDFFTASEAPAMMGASKYMTRDQLLKEKATGVGEEVTPHLQALFDRGHEVEAAIRLHIEEMLGEELYPATATRMVDDLPLLASFDGLTMDEDDAMECKLLNEELATQVEQGQVPDSHVWQLEQQMLIADLESILFVVTDGTPEKTVTTRYVSDPGKRKRLIAGWKQFQIDLDAYQHTEPELIPVAETIKALPALNIQLVGEVKNSNLVVYKETVLAFIKKINTDLQTDQDFADAEAMVKFCSNAENELETAKKIALSQTFDIDELFRTVDLLKMEMRNKRLELDKLVKARKTAIRGEIQQDGRTALAEHLAKLNQRLGKPYMPAIHADFAGVMKAKKTIASLRSAVNDELARAKIEANEIADKIELNLKSLRELAANHVFLFADTQQIIMKENDDLVALIKMRISEHDQAEAKRIEQERETIRQEEEAKARAKVQQEEAAKRETQVAEQPVIKPAVITQPGKIATRKPAPADSEIISVLANHYSVTSTTIVAWLSDRTRTWHDLNEANASA